MALYSGVTGSISVDGNKLLHMSNWDVSLSKDILEVVSFGEDYKEKVPSIKDWSATSDGSTDFATGGGQKELHEAFESGAPLEAEFYLDENTFLGGTAFIESLNISHAADGKSDISIGLAGSGANILTLPEP